MVVDRVWRDLGIWNQSDGVELFAAGGTDDFRINA
jgi:hypothetical protein